MSEYGVTGSDLKAMVKVAKKGPITFGFGVGKSDEDSYCGMHRTKAPAVVGKEAKEEGDGTKFTFGTAVVEAKTIILTIERDLPGLAKRFKRYLKSQKVMLNVQVMGADGTLIESDIQDDLPDDPELQDEDDPAPPADPALREALVRRLGEMRGRIAALAPDAAAPLVGPFKLVVDLLKAGDVARAGSGADRLDAALALILRRGAGATPAAPAPQAPTPETAAPTAPDPRLRALEQAVDALRQQAGGVADEKARATLLAALDVAAARLGAGEVEAAIAILKKLRQILATAGGGGPSPGAPAEDDAAAWQRRFREFEPRVNAALSGGLVADVGGLRAVWGWVTAQAADGAYRSALDALPRVEALLAGAAPGSQPGFAADIPPDAQPFARARVIWSTARATMMGEVRKLEAEIISACGDDPLLADVPAEVTRLSAEVARLDGRLEDKMDQIVNTPAGAAREALKTEARALIEEYNALLQLGFFQDVDAASGFGSYAVTSTATAALGDIAKVLA